jgi:hypothetical protein
MRHIDHAHQAETQGKTKRRQHEQRSNAETVEDLAYKKCGLTPGGASR